MQVAKRGGGVAIFVKQELHFSIHIYAKYKRSTSDLELIWVTINMANSKNRNIGTVYRSLNWKVGKCCD